MVLREVGERPEFEFEIRDHLELGLANGWIEMEKAGEASGSRFAYLLGDLVLVEMALVRFAIELIGAEGFVPVVPPVLVREGPLFGTGFFPGEREMIYEIPRDELFLVGTSEVSLAALHAGRDPRRRRAAAPLRGLLHLLSARGRSGGQGHARDLPRPPVRQGGDVLVRSPRGVCGGARAHAGDPGADPPGARDPLPGGGHRGRRPGRLGGAQVRLRGVDPQPGALPRAHLVLQHHRLPGPPPRLPLPARARGPARPRPHAERHRGRRRPHADRAARERAAAPTARLPCPARFATRVRRRRSAATRERRPGGPRAATRPRRPPGPGSARRS